MPSVNLLAMLSKAYGDPTKGKDDDAPYMKPNAKERVPGIVDEYVQYLKSPLYSKRLKEMEVENPDVVVNDRVRQLKRIALTVGPSSNLMYGFSDKFKTEKGPMMTIRNNESDYTAMHEISHANNHGDYFFANPSPGLKKGTVNTASGKGMSVNEMNYLVSRLKNPELRKYAMASLAQNAKQGIFNNSTDSSSTDPHYVNPSELKSDLDAVRLLFKRYGVTSSFGENISVEQIEKAKKIKEVANEPHFKRMMQNYNQQEIIDINNNIAMSGRSGSTQV
jgi:hypothetical protein